jgi:glycosyltransferase involved in cell wall biosynthesis
MSIAGWFSLLVLVASVALCGEVIRGWNRLRQLRDVLPMLTPNPPTVSMVVAARNESAAIEAAMRSILAIDYPELELIVVDDRSTDATGAILERLRGEFPRLRAVHVRDLPAGWLGKNHALHVGAAHAKGAYLVFTDADVLYEPSSLRRAVAHAEARQLDHLTIIPRLITRSNFLALGMMGGFIGILALHRPWRARETGRHGLGVGAFNMVRADAFRAAGGHEALALEVLDDIELGGLMGREGRRQDVLLGGDLLAIEMYPSVMAMFQGIQKNLFTFLDYSVARLLAATVLLFSLSIWPWVGPFVADGFARWACVGAAAAAVLLHVYLAPRFHYSRACVIYLPVMGFVTVALAWQVALRTWIQGGIVWRGTFYGLGEIREARRRMRARARAA